ncbi:hypothetical protein ACWJW6_00625 [Clostridioides difficile]|uniref:hypothetical protein n=1 Tax=Clostridioides difficile TaxID=1496 RepID=UPI001FAB3A83|nr:hypothetical protein [Clostridioides difficile]MCJ0405630.1 hypothetical protein [Clostridioides difficile]MEC5403435.1 hypothetical protein [Clostridioides difficile]
MDDFGQIQELAKSLGWLSTAITLIITFYKNSQKKIESYEEMYFNEILLPYIDKYRKNNNISSIEFLNDKNSLMNCYIPSYIFYIIDNEDSSKLHKILMVDYWKNYNSSLNNINKKFGKLSSISDFVQIFFFIFFMVFCILLALLCALAAVIELWTVSRINITIIKFFGFSIGNIIIFFMLKNSAKKSVNELKDDYTVKKEKIEKLIEKKENEYNSNYANYYIN